MLKLIFTGLLLYTSVYTIHFNSIDGVDKSFSSYEGKKILIVNVATGSNKVSQLAELQQLYQPYHDSLVIIAFPSNSFGNETRTNAEIKEFCANNYGLSFQLAGKGSVVGPGIIDIYAWLANPSANGALTGIVIGDFQKFLISKSGKLIGVFGPSVNPLDETIVDAIEGH